MGFLRLVLRLTLFALLGAVWLLAGVYLYLSPDLPEAETLRDVKLQTPMLVYTREGELIGQFGEQKRSPLPFDEIPDQFIKSLLAAEDDNYFKHRGIDLMGLMRAVYELVMTGEKGSGGSTLTMQVARNYFLSHERTFIRKFNEILLALEIERRLTKQEIFELYFNRIFLGHRSYGFEAAAQVYYGKSIAELTLAQHAMLAGVPKAPSRSNPVSGPESSVERRDWILGRMLELGYINREAFDEAIAEPNNARLHSAKLGFAAHYAAEMARQEMVDRYGLAAYTNGYHVYTTVSSELQRAANRAVVNGLIAYDKRHGYRGAEQQYPPGDSNEETIARWREALRTTPAVAQLVPAIVTAVANDGASLLLADGSTPDLAWKNGINKARPYLSENSRGAAPKKPSDVVSPGDLVRVTFVQKEDDEQGAWHLAQLPDAQAALVSLDTHDGAIVSVVGGLGFGQSKFNRATQAERQPGSNFKPFLYSAAIDAGYTAATMINDAPIVVEGQSQHELWRPENDEGKFYGPTRLRWALTKSRNLVSIRLLQGLGVRQLIGYSQQLGFDTSEYPAELSLALGTQSLTPLELATGYAILANGGYRVEPYLITRVEDAEGAEVFRARPLTVCTECELQASPPPGPEGEMSMEDIMAGEVDLPNAPRVMDARVQFIVDSMLKDVITRGTGRRALVLERNDLAGKTGTTNGPMDVWFSGYNPNVVTTTWVGFDNYTPLGRREFGGTAALPIWIDYMREALKDSPETARPMPTGIVTVKIDPDTGMLASAGQRNAMVEYFKKENAPERQSARGGGQPGQPDVYDQINDIF